MTTITRGPRATDRFAIIGNDALGDARLSYRARGLLAYLLSRPEGWTTNAETLGTQGKEGREAIRTALRELEDTGYLTRRKVQDDAGKWTHTAYVTDAPGETTDGFPGAGFPSPVSRAVSSKTESKTETKSSAPAERADAEPGLIDALDGAVKAAQQEPSTEVARHVYDATDKGVRFMAVKAVAASVLRSRRQMPESIAAAMVALYEAGKPITITTVCQVLDGALRLNGASSPRAAKDRAAFSAEWADGTAVAEWEAVAGRPVR